MVYIDVHQNFICQSKCTFCAVACNMNLCTFAGMKCCKAVDCMFKECKLIFHWLGWYLDFSSWFRENHIIWRQKDKIMKYMYLVENKAEILQHVLKIK